MSNREYQKAYYRRNIEKTRKYQRKYNRIIPGARVIVKTEFTRSDLMRLSTDKFADTITNLLKQQEEKC